MTLGILIIIGIVALISLLIAMKIFKKAIKIFLILFLVGLIATGIFIFFVFKDVQDIKQNFIPGQKKILLIQDNNILAGVKGVLFEEGKEINFISEKNLSKINSAYNSGDFNTILGESYKVFYVQKETFADVEELKLGDIKLNKEQIRQVFETEDPIKTIITGQTNTQNNEFLDSLVEDFKKESGIKSTAQARGIVFIGLIASKGSKDPLFLIKEMKTGNVEVYPKTIVFRIIDIIPNQLFEAANDVLE